MFGPPAYRRLSPPPRHRRLALRLEPLELRFAPAVSAFDLGGLLTVTLDANGDALTGTAATGTDITVSGTGYPATPFTGVTAVSVADAGTNAGQVVSLTAAGASRLALTGTLQLTGIESVMLAAAGGLRVGSLAEAGANSVAVDCDVASTAGGQQYADSVAVAAAAAATFTASADGRFGSTVGLAGPAAALVVSVSFGGRVPLTGSGSGLTVTADSDGDGAGSFSFTAPVTLSADLQTFRAGTGGTGTAVLGLHPGGANDPRFTGAGGAGPDTFNIGGAGVGSLDAVFGSLGIVGNGAAGAADTVDVIDQNASCGHGYTVNPAGVRRTGGPTIALDAVVQVDLNGSAEADVFSITPDLSYAGVVTGGGGRTVAFDYTADLYPSTTTVTPTGPASGTLTVTATGQLLASWSF